MQCVHYYVMSFGWIIDGFIGYLAAFVLCLCVFLTPTWATKVGKTNKSIFDTIFSKKGNKLESNTHIHILVSHFIHI